ncbi:Dbl homology domain-containing protein [Syncephalis fuscata]|nr:Dbl homology domain-containing protein [Syncephalis fuscata]
MANSIRIHHRQIKKAYTNVNTCIENPFETAEIIEDDGIYGSTDEPLENPFECSELEYSEDDSDAEDNRPLSAMAAIHLASRPMSNLSHTVHGLGLRPRSRSHINLHQMNHDNDSGYYTMNGRSHTTNGGLAPPHPRIEQRRASMDASTTDQFIVAVLSHANKQNSVDRAQTWSGTVSAHTLATMSEKERKRQESIFELIITEHVFLRNMVTVIEVFRQPLQSVLPSKDIKNVFLNLDEIIMYSAQLLNDLLERQESDKRILRSIGDIFGLHLSAMQCFRSYCSRASTAARYPRIVAILQEARQNSRSHKLDLSTLLIEPMQRITRYKLLLNQIHKLTPKDNADSIQLSGVIDGLETLLEETNESTRVLENIARLREINSWVDLSDLGKHFDLTGQTIYFEQRYIIMDSAIVKANSGRKLHAYLFTDMLLLTQPPKHRSTSGYKNAVYREPLLLNEIQVRGEPTSRKASAECCFQIVHDNNTITLKTANIGSKNKWIKEITKAKEEFELAKERLDGAPPPISSVLGMLRVLVCEAGALVNPDQYAFRTTVDAYCVVTVCGQQKRTVTIENSNNPRWQESFVFPVDDMRETVRVDVYHRISKYSQPEFLGSAEIDLSTLDQYGGKSAKNTFRLSNARRTGSVTLHLTFDPR